MDYRTKPTSRESLRAFAKVFRELFDVPLTGAFPVVEVLDKIPEVFEGSRYEIVEDNALPPTIMAQCSQNEENGFTIEIKESVYEGAYENDEGAFRGFICHEICHIFLFEIGFTPIFTREITNEEIPAYCSVEWQAKALCAEVMIPYDESIGMKPKEIREKYAVSKAFSQKRRKLERM